MTEPLAHIENLSKSFGTNSVFKNITLTLPKNQMIGVVGPDGSGKTTLLRLMAGLLLPTEGSIEVLGFNTVTQIEDLRKICGYMPQQFGLYEDLTVMQNLELYADLKGLDPKEAPAVFKDLLQFTQLAPFTERLAGALSGGMKQKLGLACTLLTKPKVLILDEPSVGVDPISRRELWKMVQALLVDDVSVLWSTTYLEEAQKCEKILLLNKGNVLFFGPPEELTQKVDHRVFQVEDLSAQRREHLAEWEQKEGIVDALLQGKYIRLVASNSNLEGTSPTTPRLEDAFIDTLGGIPKGESKVAKAFPKSEKTEQNAVIATGLSKKFGSFTAVQPSSFAIKQGEIFGFLGPNGAGKSTTFKMLCGLLQPTEGEAIINGINLKTSPSEARSHIGYMAQKFSLYQNLTPRQNLEFFSGIYNVTEKGRIDEMLKLFDLEPYQNETTQKLPLGIKQQLALATTCIHWPDLLFLDEPTSGMDPVSRREFWSHMNGLARKGKTIVVTTHFMDEAENCDRIALIYKGKIIYLDTPFRLKELAKTADNQNPTLEDAFIKLIEASDGK